MSQALINAYYNQVHTVRRSGATNEGALSMPFFFLLMQYAQTKKYQFHAQITIKSKKTGANIRPDGILMNELRVHRGYWESKDPDDKLDEEIQKKLHKDGYPSNNILFDDTKTAVLIQGGEEVMRIDMNDSTKLHEILNAFIHYKPEEIIEFEAALEAFKKDIPEIVETFRTLFDKESQTNTRYITASDRFLELCKVEINPDITAADVREMLIQHILTEDLFTAIFDDGSFLKYNIIARELEDLINTVITREVRQNQLGDIRYYYQTLNATAASIADHYEKQKFLKTVYENFYKVYNPKGADKLGVVYTPNEIVRFMVESTDYLLEKHFNKNLHDKGVEILDPATGTGTFITDIIEHIAPQYLPYKYANELHANEVSILPYYIANLNIEYTYKQKMGRYMEFKNICFVDTLDNIDALTHNGKQTQIQGFGFSGENAERIKRQNERKISVIIGNPPYNANQINFNDFNSNREYWIDAKKKTGGIDGRIKETFVYYSTAQKTKVYDMYARFYRWAMDRLNGTQGVITMVTNNSFVNSRTFDGFRKCIQDEFDYCYIVDLGGNVRELSGKDGVFIGEAHTVFGLGAMIGIAIMFLVKKEKTEEKGDEKRNCMVKYIHPCDIRATRLEKFEWLQANPFQTIAFDLITPSPENNWINPENTNKWAELVGICSKNAKLKRGNETIFEWYSLGISTNRDAWVYDLSAKHLEKKVAFFIDFYNKFVKNNTTYVNDTTIKWSRDLKQKFERKLSIPKHKSTKIIKTNYRPFCKRFWYAEKMMSDIFTQNHYDMFGASLSQPNKIININVNGHDVRFLASNIISDLHFLGDNQCLPLYRYDSEGKRHDNITDWALREFTTHYKDETITKEAIFEYTYAALHNPTYRTKYEINLKRDFPRLPFYSDFWKSAAWGKTLMELHINYENAAPYALVRIDKGVTAKVIDTSKVTVTYTPKVKLKADKSAGIIEIDDITTLEGIPSEAWQYTLGNRSALEWVLDQYKEKKISDTTIAEQFDTYRFADYKEEVIDLLMRLTTVSTETMQIMADMV